MIREGIQKLIEGRDLTFNESSEIMREVMSGKTTNAQTASFLTALRMKGEVVEELIAFTSIMRSNCCSIQPKVQGRLVDTCGTGGDKIKTFNVSTAAAFVIAGAGVAVAKHGNRAVTSKSGSADVLGKMGLKINLEPKEVESIIERIGIGFMFAQTFHPAMKYAAETRREIGIRTVFNVLGPLSNPACANAQLLGVYDSKLVVPIAFALDKLGCLEAMVVHGVDGLDEISTVGKTVIAHLKKSNVTKLEFVPSNFPHMVHSPPRQHARRARSPSLAIWTSSRQSPRQGPKSRNASRTPRSSEAITSSTVRRGTRLKMWSNSSWASGPLISVGSVRSAAPLPSWWASRL